MLLACQRAPQETVTERANADDVISVTADDPEMLHAFSKARETLGSFLRLVESKDRRVDTPSVKVKIEDDGKVEYFWIADLAVTGTNFSGNIDNDPDTVHSVKLGQRITFTKSQIYDWTYVDSTSQRTIGNFTACALLTHESPKDAAEFRAKYRLACDT